MIQQAIVCQHSLGWKSWFCQSVHDSSVEVIQCCLKASKLADLSENNGAGLGQNFESHNTSDVISNCTTIQ